MLNYFDAPAVWSTITLRWRTLLAVLIAVIALVTFYLLITSPLYRADIDFVPPTKRDIQNLTLFEVGVAEYTPDELFVLYGTKLAFMELQREFLTKHLGNIIEGDVTPYYVTTTGEGRGRKTGDWSVRKTITWKIVTTDDQSIAGLRLGSNLLTISTIKDPENRDVLRLRIGWRNPQEASELANQYSLFVSKNLIEELVDNLEVGLNNSIVNIKSNITFKRLVARTNRENQIKILEEAAEIAESLGYDEPVNNVSNNTLIQITPPEQFFLNPKVMSDPPKLLRQRRYFPMYQIGSVTRSGGVTTQGSTSPLYFRGAKVLRTEARALATRISDDPYIPELTTLIEQRNWLESIHLTTENISIVGHYERADSGKTKRFPDIILYLSVGSLFGLLIGLITILTQQAFASGINVMPNSLRKKL